MKMMKMKSGDDTSSSTVRKAIENSWKKMYAFEIDNCRMKKVSPWSIKFVDGVPRDWIDLNGHMNIAAYTAVFQRGGYLHFLKKLEIDGVSLFLTYPKQFRTSMVLQNNVRYRKELKERQAFTLNWQMIDFSDSMVHSAMWIEAGNVNDK